MTLPTNINLPLHSDRIRSQDPKELDNYFRDLIFELTRMYESIAQGVNGDIRGDFSLTGANWKPTIKGTTEGVNAVITYVPNGQVGYVLRKGLLVDVWFDIEWSAIFNFSDNLYVELPYKVAKVSTASKIPFVGVVQPSSITYTGGTEMVINAIPNTFRGELWNTGSAFPTANQTISATGRLIGHLRYLGTTLEIT